MRMQILKIITLISLSLFIVTGNYLAFAGFLLFVVINLCEKLNFSFIFHDRPVYKFSKNYF